MSTEQNKATVRRFYQAFEADDETALNELLAPDLVAYSHGSSAPQNHEVHVQGIRMWNAIFSDTHYTVHEQIAEGEKVATRVTLRAVHSRGEFQGVPPTAKVVTIDAVTIERIRDGRIVERRVNSDWMGMLQQLGLLPPLQPAR